MPLYEYRCDKCGRVEEKLFKVADAPQYYCCNQCCEGEDDFGYMYRQVSSGGFILKGTGWYKTDFKGDKPQ